MRLEPPTWSLPREALTAAFSDCTKLILFNTPMNPCSKVFDREELEFILEAAPAERRTLMFSATMAKPIENLARKYQRDAVRVNTVSGEPQHADIEYRAMVVASHEAENAIFNVLRYYDAPNALVLCSTRAAVTRMMSRFTSAGRCIASAQAITPPQSWPTTTACFAPKCSMSPATSSSRTASR